jgi:hypothetical protein
MANSVNIPARIGYCSWTGVRKSNDAGSYCFCGVVGMLIIVSLMRQAFF